MLAKIKEENIALSASRKIPNQAAYESAAAALGNPMEWRELVRRMKKLNPSLVIRDGGMPNAIAVYIFRDNHDGDGPRLTYISGFDKKVLPEYSSVTVDEHGVALHEVRGWRTVMKKLYEQRCCTWEAAIAVFGDALGQRSEGWKGSIIHPEQRKVQ
jgi:hypothetical protein